MKYFVAGIHKVFSGLPGIFICLFLFFGRVTAHSQVPEFSKVPNLYDGDSIRITNLIANGIKVSKGKVICWFPKDSLSPGKMNSITDTINKGISGAEKYLGVPLPWQSHPLNLPYTFYFIKDTIISHASSAGFVSISFWRIKEDKAPWLHEALHEMLDTKTGNWSGKDVTEDFQMKHMPLWLFEGLADYISLQVSLSENLTRYDVFSRSYSTNNDSLYLHDENTDKQSYILSYIGARGILPELSSKQRVQYAPGFYHGSCSFVNFLTDKYGIKMLLAAISDFGKETETIQKISGKSIDQLKKEWLNNINPEKGN